MANNNSDTKKGIIIKSIGGLYTVESPDGIYICKARGIFRKTGDVPFVGDNVEIQENVIVKLDRRKNCIIRPPLANLDQLIFIVSMCEPSPNYMILDKFIAISEYKNIKPIIVLTKTDLEDTKKFLDVYTKVDIEILKIDYDNKNTIINLKSKLINKKSAFTGNSGVGKSTLLNEIDSRFEIATSEISKKLGRGKHTTRHVELYKIEENSYIADTPGFSTFETNKYDIIKKEELDRCFIEFKDYLDKCYFKDCSHTKEKKCAILQSVEDNNISKSRHESYCQMYEEAKLIKEWEL